MDRPVKNYRRFYAAFNKLPKRGDDEETKAALVSQYTHGRTAHLHEMKPGEYASLCQGLENMCGYGDQRRRHRSIALHLMQEVGVDTQDWQRINDFCRHPRICGKEFALLTIPELEALQLKLRAIKRKGGLESEGRRAKSNLSEERRVKSEESSPSSKKHKQQRIIIIKYGTEQGQEGFGDPTSGLYGGNKLN